MKKQVDQKIKLDRKSFIRKSDNINNSYDVDKKPLASGSYGAVHKCKHKITKEERAVKIIPKFKMDNLESFLSEVEMLRLVVIWNMSVTC